MKDDRGRDKVGLVGVLKNEKDCLNKSFHRREHQRDKIINLIQWLLHFNAQQQTQHKGALLFYLQGYHQTCWRFLSNYFKMTLQLQKKRKKIYIYIAFFLCNGMIIVVTDSWQQADKEYKNIPLCIFVVGICNNYQSSKKIINNKTARRFMCLFAFCRRTQVKLIFPFISRHTFFLVLFCQFNHSIFIFHDWKRIQTTVNFLQGSNVSWASLNFWDELSAAQRSRSLLAFNKV